jgi:hypothetical protein
MRQLALAIATITVVATISAIARADMVGAAAGAGSGLVVAGPVGAVAGGVVGGVFGRPFWGPPDQSRRMLGRQLLPTPLLAWSSVIITESRLELRLPAAWRCSLRSAAPRLW